MGSDEEEFSIIGKDELQKKQGKNLKEDLINMGFLDYNNLDEGEKKIFDELDKVKKNDEFY